MKFGSFILGILVGLVLAILIGVLALPKIGVFDMTATGEPGLLDWWGSTNLHSLLEKRAPEAKIPPAADPAQGIDHFAAVCRQCHGAPKAPRDDWAQRMLPMPPQLWEAETQAMTDGQLFYIVANGVRMSGMPAFGPAHSEEEIWNLVALLRGLDKLDEAQVRRLQGGGQPHRHGEGGQTEHPEQQMEHQGQQ